MAKEDSSSLPKYPQAPGTQRGMEGVGESLTAPSVPRGNHGWDNENNDLILHKKDILINEITHDSYMVVDTLGQGTFGQVIRCYSDRRRCLVAVKIIKNQAAFHQQAMIEVKILQCLSQNYDADRHNFVRLLDSFRFKNHLCLVFELLQRNLFELIRFSGYQGFSLSLVRHFIKQVLQTLMILHQERIIHGDLKPENVLMSDERNGLVKVIDFGSSCMEHETVYSYIQSRFYRSPEVVLAYPYDSAIDMWSLGCIAAELYLGLPLFPADSERDLLSRMIEILGPIPLTMLSVCRRVRRYFKLNPARMAVPSGEVQAQDAYQLLTQREFEERNGEPAPTARNYFQYSSLKDIILKSKVCAGAAVPEGLDCFLDFLLGLLRVDPQRRWTAEQAAAHPFVTGAPFHGPFHPPPSAPRPISRPVGIASMHDPRHQSSSWHPNAATHSFLHEVAMYAVSQVTGSVASNSSYHAPGPMVAGSVATGSGTFGISPETQPIWMAALRAGHQAFSNPSCPSTFMPAAQPDASPGDRRISGFHVVPQTQCIADTSVPFSEYSQGPASLGTRHSRPMADINEDGPHVEDCEISFDLDVSTLSHALESSHLQPPNSTSLEQNNDISIICSEGSQIDLGNAASRHGNGGGVPRPFFTSGPSARDNIPSAWQMPIASQLHGVQAASSQSFEHRLHGVPSNNASGVSFSEGRAFLEEASTYKNSAESSGPTTLSHQSFPWSEGISIGQLNNEEAGLYGRSSGSTNRQAAQSHLSQPAHCPFGPRSPQSLFHEELLDEE